jgi:DNA-binding CsgD family transcriptional regulator/tetratricopeptide (TPR) repeat protein
MRRGGQHNRPVDLAASVGIRWTAAETPAEVAADLAGRLATSDEPDLHLALGLLRYIRADFANAATSLERAYLAFRRDGRIRRAAVAAAHLGRLHHDGIGNTVAAGGWFARGRRLLADDDCVERGWVVLATVGCSVADIERLTADAGMALRLAHRFDEIDLECKALADSGLALVTAGCPDEGMARIDESMAVISAGECDNQFIAAQVVCCLVSACERAGDLPRLEAWLADRVRRDELMPDGAPTMLYGHCQSEYGSLLCHAGRWSEADTTLRLAVAACDSLHFHHRAESRAALAQLRIGQGRLHEAAALLDGLDQRNEAQLAIAGLHHARGDDDLAAATLRKALRARPGDRMRGAPLLALLVRAELGRGRLDAARSCAAALTDMVAAVPDNPALTAMAHLATGRVAAASGEVDTALGAFEAGLRALGGGGSWPLLAAELHHELARLLADSDVPAAVTDARAALAVFGPIGAHEAHDLQDLLHRLGVGAMATGPAGPGRLTTREREILGLLGEGMSNPQIAQRLVISPKTAEHHVGAILRKLHLRSRAEAALYAASVRG